MRQLSEIFFFFGHAVGRYRRNQVKIVVFQKWFAFFSADVNVHSLLLSPEFCLGDFSDGTT